MNIRTATSRDSHAIRSVHLDAFPKGEGEAVAQLAADLLEDDTTPETLSLVAERDGVIVGHVAFSPVFVAGNDEFNGYILAPLGVSSVLQKGGVGRALVEHGMRRLAALSANAVFVYGDPDYYGRFGFSAEAARGYSAPFPLQYPLGWQARILDDSDPNRSSATITCVESLSDPGLW